MTDNANSVLQSYAPGGAKTPDLIAFLALAYGKPLNAAQLELVDFFRTYLVEHRPSEFFTVPYNFGFRLTNAAEVTLCPATPGQVTSDGSMANPDNSVKI
jgi:hypothetical protein